ncbi:Uncharacterized protein C31H12.03c [Erysiphe neolycopersici]|uniref:Uncharacterized protein C31H12.03c n=1 Tax=Erysiphe neolycopersici TaxID=212602 RepID=A0A420I3B9_9PEZI|nr:Uncharacterized protein C31H12.03c [Erysiphe neolycopersici]
MATEYPSLKVPDLKKLLQERSLPVSGNKAELVSRLQEDDKKSGANNAGEDEIDWEEDDKIASTTPAIATTTIITPAKTKESEEDSSITKIDNQPVTTQITQTQDTSKDTSKDTNGSEKPVDAERSDGNFSLGLGNSDTILEAEKRAARAKRFGKPQSEEAVKMAERAKKFRLPSSKDEVIQNLDTALPERRPKRMRDEKDRPNPRSDKRHGNDRRNDNRSRNNNYNTGLNKMKISAILDDPIERAKAEARAKRFARPVIT